MNYDLIQRAREHATEIFETRHVRSSDMIIDLVHEIERLERVVNASEEVVECLLLENMQRPSFTFRRIEILAEVLEKLYE